MKRMPKYIPEIRISPSDYSRREKMENDSYSECAMSDVATDCETLEANYSKRSSKVLQGKIEHRDEDVILTDVDASSDDERETVIRYPVDYINSILALGMSCEEISNTQGPNKRQKSITCSLERSKPRSLNADEFDEGGTDVEGVFMSEDEDAYRIDSDSEVQGFEPNAYVSISDKVVTGTIASPGVTPEPYTGRKKRTSNLTAPIPITSMLTDTEMLISDTESNSTRSRKTTKCKPFKTMFDGLGSDTDDSDSSTERRAKANCRPNRKINCSRSFDNIRYSSSMKNNILAPITRVEDDVTDTEHICLGDAVSKMINKSFETRPTVIRLNKPIQSSESASTVRFRHNSIKSRSQPTPQVSIYSSKKCNEKVQKHPGCGLYVPLKDETGNATDVEAIGSDSDDQTITIKPVAYLPDPRCELIIDNESHKGTMAFILPITDSQKGQSLRADDLDCGYSDVEDLPGFEADEYFRYPTPDLPRTEHSTVQNKEAVIDPSKLAVGLATKEPLTDTEELDLSQKPMSGNRLKVKLYQRKNKDVNESLTDIEDLDGSDTEDKKVGCEEATDDVDQVELTDVGELSSDDSDDESIFRFSAATPDLEINNTYTNARESMSPFSFDIRRKLNDIIPKIRTTSPSPIPRNTSTEDFLASQEESANSNWASDDGQIEAHSSQVHLKLTRKFNIDEAEKLHIKDYMNNPDPTTDVEELTILEALEELRKKKRKLQQKRKEQSEGTSNKVCYSGHKGPSNKPNTRIYKSSGRHDKPRGAEKSKEAVNSSWLSQRKSGFREMGINTGEGLKSSYDNVNSVYYKEMADESVYPPQLGYAEFESHDVLGSTSSLAQEHGTDTFSELLFSSSNSESEEPDENFPISKEYETYGILYDMSSHINKVPEVFAKRMQAQARPDSPQDLESRLKYYHNLCNRSLSPEVHGVSSAERAELNELEESISQMLIDIRREEQIFYSDNFEGATGSVKRRPKPKKYIQNENYQKLNEDGETALKEIESHIFKLLQDVEKEEREVMGSLRRDSKNSSEKLEESVPSPWDMINATTTNDSNPDVSYVRFHESSCTPSPVESSSTSDDEYVIPRVELNIGSRMGRSTIDISAKNSPTPQSTRMNASKKYLNRSLPSLKSSSLSLAWKNHNSSESIFGSPTLWQSSSVEYISPPQQIVPGSGYCIWSYPSEEEYGEDQVTDDGKKTPAQDENSKETLDQSSKNDGKRSVKKEPAKKNEKPLYRKDSYKRLSPDKTSEPSKKLLPDKTAEPTTKLSSMTPEPFKGVSKDKTLEPSKKASPDKTPEPSKRVSPDKTTDLSKKVSPDKTPDPYKKISPDKTSAPSKRVPDKKPETPKKVSPEKSAEPLKKGSPDRTPEPSKKVSPVKADKKLLEKGYSKKSQSPEKNLSTNQEKVIATKAKSSAESTAMSSEKVMSKSLKSPEKAGEIEVDDSKTISIDATKKELTKSETTVEQNGKTKEDHIKVEENITKQAAKPVKGAGNEKKSTILGKTIETIKKPFQDKGGVKEENSKGKEKRKYKSVDSIKTPSLEIDEPVQEAGEHRTKPELDSEGQETTKKSKGKGKDTEQLKTLSGTTSEEQEKSIIDLKGKKTKTDGVTSEDEGMSKERKGKQKGKEKSESPKGDSFDKGNATEKKAPKFTQVDASSESKNEDRNQKDRGKRQSVDRTSVVEPLIEKTIQDITVISVGSVTEDKVKKDATGSPKSDNSKGKGKDKGKEKPRPSKTPSLEESDKPQKSDPNIVGKAVEIIKKPFLSQAKSNEDTKAAQRPGKGTKQMSIGPSKILSFDTKEDTANKQAELASLSKSDENDEQEILHPENYDTKTEKLLLKDNNSKGKGKGKQKSTDPTKTPSLDEGIAVQNEPKLKTVLKQQNKGPQIPEPSKRDSKKKGKGNQKPTESPNTPPLEEEGGMFKRVLTTEPVLTDKTLENVKRPFQGKKDEKPASKQEQTKKGEGKSKQKSTEIVRQSSTEEPKEGSIRTTETVRLISKLPGDKSCHVTDEKVIDQVTKPFNVKLPLYKSELSTEESIRPAILIEELSQEKSGQETEEKATELVSKPLEQKDTVMSGGTVTTTTITLSNELSKKQPSQIMKEVEDLTHQPLQEISSTQKQVVDSSEKLDGKLPSGKIVTAKVISLTRNVSPDATDLVQKELDVVSRPLQEMFDSHIVLGKKLEGETSITGPLIQELSHEKSGFIIEERPIDLVSQPFQDILESVHQPSLTKQSHDRCQIVERSTSEEDSSATGPLMKELPHLKIGFTTDERPMDLVSQPLQGILGTLKPTKLHPSDEEGTKSAVIMLDERSDDISRSFEETRELPPSSIEGTKRAVSLMKELSQDKSGHIIEEGAIDLVAQPFLGGMGQKEDGSTIKKKESKSKTGGSKKKDGSTNSIDDFEHIQKTIDDARSQFDQFVGIISDKAPKLSADKTDERKPNSKITDVTSQIMRTGGIEGGEILPTQEQEVEIPVEKEEDLLRFQETLQHRFQDIPSEKSCPIDIKTLTTITKLTEQGIENALSPGKEKVVGVIDEDTKKATHLIQHGFQKDTLSEKTGTSDMKTETTTLKTVAQGKGYNRAGKVVGAVDDTVPHAFQDIPCGEFGTISIETVATTVSRPIEHEVENVQIQGEKAIGAVDKDTRKVTGSIQHGFQDISSGKSGTVDLETVKTSISKPNEQEAQKCVGDVNMDAKKVTETVSKSLDGGVIILEKIIDSQIKSLKDIPATCIDKNIGSVKENLRKLDGSFLSFDKNTNETDLSKVEKIDHHQLNFPYEKAETINMTTLTEIITQPIERRVENLCVRAENVAEDIEKEERDNLKSTVDEGDTTILETIESRVKTTKDAPTTYTKESVFTVKETQDDGFEGLGAMEHETVELFGLSQPSLQIDTKDLEQTDKILGQEVFGKDTFPPELRAQSIKIATFETVETISPQQTEESGRTKILTDSSSNDEIGWIIKEMESQLLSTKFGLDECTVDDGSEKEIEDCSRESRTMPTTPLPARKVFGGTETISDSEGDSKPYVTTPTLSRRVGGVGGSQRLTQDERPVVRVITEYVGDLNENEPEEDTYTILEPEVREKRKFKIRFSPDMYGSEDKEDVDLVKGSYDEAAYTTTEELERLDSIKSGKNIKRIERKFERMTSQTKEADPSMSEVTEGEFQRMVSQLSLEEMDHALYQWDVGGLTPSEIDSKDLTLSSDDTTSPLQQGLTDIFRPNLSSILPTSIYVEKTGTQVGSSGFTESSKMKLSLVKDSVPQIFQSVETDGQVREGSHILEPGETGETPPIPSPRTPLKPTDSEDKPQDQTQILDKDDDESKNYATRKMFWEQISTGSVEAPSAVQEITPPVPKPRIRSSISQSIDLLEGKKAVSHSEASIDQEVSEIGESENVLHSVTSTASVACDMTSERGLSLDTDANSEIEFIKSHDIEELSYDNDAFDDDTPKHFPFPEPKQRKGIYERSVSLPGDTTIDISNNVRSKKRIFEAQIKKEMVVEQLMSQMEEEGSPEHKAFAMTSEPTDQAAMLNRQIHSEIVSHELEEQIESNLLENKALVQDKVEHLETCIPSETKQNAAAGVVSPVKTEDDPSETDKTNTSSELPSIYETKISTTVAEVLHYKNDAISKPSDSLEVHVDKSELEDTEKVKDIEEELRVIDEKNDNNQQASSDQVKVSSITSSRGESEDTFSESDVTPEDARFKEQHDIQVWGPSDKEVKRTVDILDEQKKTRSIHTPEEHIPDTVWEVPVQESTETLEVETVGQLPTTVSSWRESGDLTESEARKIAELFVGATESELLLEETVVPGSLSNEKESSMVKTPEKTPTTKKSDNILKLIRTDTTTSSMEITDEDLRSSGMTDNSPLESQAGIGLHMGGQRDVFDEDSGDDVDAQELDRDSIGKDVVEKTLAEVKQSLEAVKEELIEEKKKKRDSITKESPSEFEFKALVLEKTFTESIQEHHQEEATVESRSMIKTTDRQFPSRTEKSEVSKVEKSYSSFEQISKFESETKTSMIDKLISEGTVKDMEPIYQTYETSEKEEIKFEENKTSAFESTTLSTTSSNTDIQKDQSIEPKEVKTPGSTTGSEVSIKSAKSQDTVIQKDSIEKQESGGVLGENKKVIVPEDVKDESISQIVTLAGLSDTSSKPDLDLGGADRLPVEIEDRKSPLDDVFSNSSSSDYKGGSNDASTLDKPNIIVRKHKKSTLGNKDPKSDGELYSSSGSHYESFEQTSESIKSPGSRPLSSDMEGLVAAAAGMTTGSSEYESAVSHEISGQSTTITSREYQTAASSLSSRDSMKSLDSESSGNLASIEVSSEASETLVPSAMELEKDSDAPAMKHQKISSFPIDNQVKMQSFSESIEQSVSFDISGEDISEDDYENQVLPDQEQAIRMKRSHEMTFQPEPRPIVLEGEPGQGQDEKLASSLDDMSSLISTATDTGANRTVIELSKTESERMDGSATSEQLSLTVSGTSDLMSLSESREIDETTVLSKTETIATQSPPFQQSAGGVESVTITTSSVIEQGIQSVCTQVTSKVEMRQASHSNGPTQVEYNAEYDEGDHEVKKRGHRRNGSTSFRPSMIPVLQTRDAKKKSEDLVEDSAESDKYSQPLTVKEGTHEEKKDVDETEKPEEEFYKTEADQAMNRDLREGRISIGDASYGEGAKSFDSSLGTKSRLHSVAFSDDHPDSEIAELLKQCSSDIPSEDPIERPKTPEPFEECELKDDTPEFSSEAQASVTELEMEYSGAFSRLAEYAAHVSPIREKGLPAYESWEHLSEGEQTIDDPMLHSPDPLHLGFEDSASEKHELETHESTLKEKNSDRSKYVSSPVPDITVTQHMHPTPQDSFEKIEIDSSVPSKSEKVDGSGSSESGGASKGTEDKKDEDSASDSPTSDSFELLEKPDLADEFVIIEEVGREASEHDTEGKSVKIDMKRVTSRIGRSSDPPVISPPTTVTKMTQVKYFSSGATEEEIPFDFDSGSPAKSAKSEKESSQEGSPPSAEEPDFKPDLEASKKWMEMQFQGAEPIAQIYGYDVEYDRGPLEDIKEEDINDLEGSSRIGSMGSQVSQSIGSFGSVKESLSSTPDYDVLAGRKFFTRSGEHDDVSMSSLQEFERLEHLIAMESSKHKSLGSQDSLTSSSNNSKKHGSRSGGDDISLASLKEFEGLESACIAAERIEKKAKAEEESLLSEIEEGHESQASESESCATISVDGMQRGESDEDDYERRMFEIDEIIRQAQTNVEQFMDSKNRETVEGGLKSETLGRADSLEEISKVPELDLDQPLYSVSYSSGKSYIQQWEDLGDDLITSTDSLELKTQKSKTSVVDPFTTSTDSLDVKVSQEVMSVSTDSIEASQKVKKKDIMTDSIEVGEKTSMLTSIDSLDGKVTQANSIDEDEHHAMGTYDQSSSSGKEGDLSSSGKDDSAEGAVGMNRMPPPRAEYLLGSTDSLEPTSSTATHATYQYETDSVMSSSFTSGDSTTMVDDNDEEGAARASMWFDEGKPYVTEVIEPIIGDEDFSHVIHRKVEMPPEIHKVSFKGMEAEHALREYIEKFDPGEDCTETREVDEHGNVHVKRIIQKRVIVRPEELGGDTTDLSGHNLEKYLQTLTQSQAETEPLIDTIHSSSESHSTLTTSLRTTTTLSQGESIKTEQEQKQTVETHRRGSRPPLKYDISVDEEPEFDPTEHDWRFNLHTHIERDEETQEGAYGFSENTTKGAKK